MKSDRRHELQTNELATRLAHWIEQAKPYSKTAAAAAVAALVLLFAYFYLTHQSQARQAEGWDEYFAALNANKPDDIQGVIDRHPGSTVAHFARLRLADGLLGDGVEELFTDREQAHDKLRKAVDHYAAVRDETASRGPLKQRALLGLGRSREALNQIDEARQDYKAAVDCDPKGALAIAAQQRLDDLERQGTREFLDWFAARETKPAGSAPGGRRPDFDFQSLPDEPALDAGARGSSFDKALGGDKPAEDAAAPATTDAPAAEAPAAEGQANGAAPGQPAPDAAAPQTPTAPDAAASPGEQDASGS